MNHAFRSAAFRAALIVVLTIGAYWPATHAGFIWDDKPLITENRLVRAGDGLRRFWFTTEPPDYYPLTWSVWWLEWRLWGNNPTGYHLLNVLLHAANAVLVWQALQRLKVAGAWVAALVFAVHPVNVATVAWISEQKNTLSLLFFLIACLLYLRFDDESRRRWYWLSLAAFLLALLSKTAVVMLPVVLLLCVWWRRRQLRTKDWLLSAPFFLVSLVFGLVTIWFQSQRALEGAVVRPEGFWERLAAAGWVPWFYLWKALWPVDLMVIYPKWRVEPSQWLSYAPGLAWLICFAVCYRKRTSWGRPLLFGLGYFVGMLFPVLGFFDQGFYVYALVADHWQYHAIIGVIAVVVAAWGPLLRGNWQHGIGAAVVLLLAVGTWKRAGVYKHDETLWLDNVARNPSAWTYNNLANSLREAGKTAEALPYFERAVQLGPDLAPIRYNYGVALRLAGRIQEEIAQYRRALEINPKYAEVHYNLGLALWQAGNQAEAMRHWELAVQSKPDMTDAHNNLGVALGRIGRAEEELWHYQQAVRIDPTYAKARNNLADALARRGRTQEAIEQYRQTLRLQPDLAQARCSLGLLLAAERRFEEAMSQYREALRIQPDYADAWNALGSALWQTGQTQEAIRHFRRALQIQPDHAEARYNLGGALELSGDVAGAIEQYELALRFKPDLAPAQQRLARLRSSQRPP